MRAAPPNDSRASAGGGGYQVQSVAFVSCTVRCLERAPFLRPGGWHPRKKWSIPEK